MAIEVLPDHLIVRMTPQEQLEYRDWLLRETALGDFMSYMEFVGGIQRLPHTVLLCEWLDALLEGRLYRSGPGPMPVPDEKGRLRHPETNERPKYHLAIYEPPRYGKSMAVSQFFPAYATTKLKFLKTHFATYEAEFAKEWSGKVLDILNGEVKVGDEMRSYAEFFDVHVKQGSNAAKERWTVVGGADTYKCAGVAGPITGKGRLLGIGDDLIKNAKEANSETIRNDTGNWWTTTWWTRRQKWPDGTPSREILMNTRWHADDISARVVGDDWAVLALPAIALPDAVDPLGRLPGEPLWPEFQDVEELEKLDSDDTQNGGMGRQWFAAMYQQRPYIQDGNMIHGPFNYAQVNGDVYDLKLANGEHVFAPVANCTRFGVMDLAASTKSTADWTVLGIFDVTPTAPRRMILRHVIRERVGTDLHETLVVEGYRKWGLRFVAVEDKMFGTNLLNQLRRRGGIIVRGVKADTDKVTRALPLDALVKNEQLWWMGEANWRTTLDEEVLQFPNGKHDDQVDVLAYAARIFEGLPSIRKPKEEAVTPDEKAAEYLRKRLKKKSSTRHPILGRI